jgi:hypothetical protein
MLSLLLLLVLIAGLAGREVLLRVPIAGLSSITSDLPSFFFFVLNVTSFLVLAFPG